MTRALAYCAFLAAPEVSLPQTGVGGAAVRMMAAGRLRLLWSEVEWPPPAEQMQRSALEFHGVVSHIFRQRAVVPFRLLSVFDSEQALDEFAKEHEPAFVADLERLKDSVQMEGVVYPSPEHMAAAGSRTGTEYLRKKAVLLQSAGAWVKGCVDALSSLASQVRTRENKNGTRLFALVERGRESEFRQTVSAVPLPQHLSRRISGPWPAAEFLSDRVRMPNRESTADQRG